MHVGKVLRRLRKAKQPRMTQEALARVACVHSVTLSRIERCVHNPDLATLEALAEGLGTTVEAVLAAARQPEPEPDANGDTQPAGRAAS